MFGVHRLRIYVVQTRIITTRVDAHDVYEIIIIRKKKIFNAVSRRRYTYAQHTPTYSIYVPGSGRSPLYTYIYTAKRMAVLCVASPSTKKKKKNDVFFILLFSSSTATRIIR